MSSKQELQDNVKNCHIANYSVDELIELGWCKVSSYGQTMMQKVCGAHFLWL